MSDLFMSIMEGLKEVGEMTGNAEAVADAQYYLENGVDESTESDAIVTV